MYNISETRKALELSLGEDLAKQYIAKLRQFCSFKNKNNMSKLQFDMEARKLLTTEEQVHHHNRFLLALVATSTKAKIQRNTSDKGTFEIAELIDYMQSSNTTKMPTDFENRSAAAELFQPDVTFINARIAIHSWENGLDGAEANVADVLVQACQSYVKNIISAMLTRKEGYKVRDRFQYSVGLPIPNPFIRNTNNIIDSTQESKTEVSNTTDSFIPAIKNSLEATGQQMAFSYACSNQKESNGKLTVKLLFDTLQENPDVVGLHSVNSINLLKVGLDLE